MKTGIKKLSILEELTINWLIQKFDQQLEMTKQTILNIVDQEVIQELIEIIEIDKQLMKYLYLTN